MFDKCGPQNLVNLIGGKCKQISGFVLEERKKHQQIELLFFVSALVVSTKELTKEKSLFVSLISLLFS